MEIKDKYNSLKIWCIKKYSASNFYVNQKIGGKLFYNRYQRLTKTKLKEIGIMK